MCSFLVVNLVKLLVMSAGAALVSFRGLAYRRNNSCASLLAAALPLLCFVLSAAQEVSSTLSSSTGDIRRSPSSVNLLSGKLSR